MEIAIILIALFGILLVLGVPIAIAIAGAPLLVIAVSGTIPVETIVLRIYASMNSFILMAIPFFMLIGVLMERSGITERLLKFAKAILGWLPYGMTYVTSLTGVLMGGISGSAAADTAALSSVLVPTMSKTYPKAFLVPLLASAGSIGIIIPPSLCMVIIGSVTNISISKLFIAGIIPGVIVGTALMVCSYIICRKNGWGARDITKFSMKLLTKALYEAGLALVAPLIIIGGLLLGVFTPTEAAAVGAFYCLIIGLFVYRTIRFKDLASIFMEAANGTAIVMFIIGCSQCFSWLLTRYNFPALLGNAVLGISSGQFFIFVIFFIAFGIGGMFIDGTPLVIMLAPILFPTAIKAGIDPLVIGIFMVINVAVGGVSPPVGAPLFVACSVADIKIQETIKYVYPFLLATSIVGILCAAVPALCTWLPSFMR